MKHHDDDIINTTSKKKLNSIEYNKKNFIIFFN